MTTTKTGGRRLGQSVHVLLTDDIRAFTLGMAHTEARDGGYDPNEGDIIRRALDLARESVRRKIGPEAYGRAMEEGRRELARRAAEKRSRVAAGKV